MIIINRPPNDNFTMRLFSKVTGNINQPCNRIYVWSIVLEPNYFYVDFYTENTELKYRKMILENIKKDLVIIGIKDHLTPGNFDPWKESKPLGVENIEALFDSYPEKTFVLFTSLENLGEYLTNKNLHIIPWGGDLTNQHREYPKIKPVMDKDFDSPYCFISLNRNARTHRAMMVSLLFGLGLDKTGLISCMFEIDKLPDWHFEDYQTDIRRILESGVLKLKNSELLLKDDREIYTNNNNNNTANFETKLRSRYEKTFVEIITETSFTEKSFNLTEKTLNSIYGCNFPILLSSKGSVKFLREMGLDMFDDIVDHSYDEIDNPIDRLHSAVSNNLTLLTDGNIVKGLWKQNQQRFLNNIDFVKKDLYDFYSKRANIMFNDTGIK